MKQKFIILVLKVKMLIDHVIEGFSNGFKLLFLVSELGLKSPKQLCEALNMAKSNLAILAGKLKEDKCLVQEKSQDSNKEIYYSVTKLGKSKLEQKISEVTIDDKVKEELFIQLKQLLNK